MLGTFAPALVALWLTHRTDGRRGLAAIGRRLLDWEVGVRWYLFAFAYMAGVRLAGAGVHRLVAGTWPAMGLEPWYVMAAGIVISTPFQAGEEIGWRGYALPRLAARVGLARASVMLGVVWAAWHLPLFFVPGVSNTGQPFLPFALGNIALSVAMAWLYGHTRGSLLLMMLMHSAVNNTRAVMPTAVPGAVDPFAVQAPLTVWILLGVMWLCAACFLARMPPAPPVPEKTAVT